MRDILKSDIEIFTLSSPSLIAKNFASLSLEVNSNELNP
jgi:hypothetical protein